MKNKKIYFWIILIVVVLITAFTFNKRHSENQEQIKADYKVTNTWELPEVLNEISGIAWAGDNLIACVQDENGKIFLYDLAKKKITQEIQFADAGDYEGIAIVGEDAYVMRSDGLLFYVSNYRNGDRKVTLHQTQFSADNNMESLCFDEKSKSLLTIPKDIDEDKLFKSIYQLSLEKEKPTAEAIAKISMDSERLKEFKGKKINKTFNPSEVGVDAKTGGFFVLEGKDPKLLSVDTKGEVNRVYKFDKSVFAQPEGLAFSTDGRMFISNEAGKKGNANILEVELLD